MRTKTDKYLTVTELAKRFKVNIAWIYRYIKSDTDPLPHYRIGRFVRFLESEVEEWLKRQKYGKTV